jgi:ParB family chromosome partitioning protein
MTMAEDKSASRLGRGLAALIGDPAEPEETAVAQARGQRMVAIELIAANPRNPRQQFDESDLEDLSRSIREKGIVQPLIVRVDPGDLGRYQLIAGERRWRAAQRAGIHDVPCVIRDVNDREALEIAIIENVQRADLNPLEEARGYQKLIDDYDYSQNEVARIIGKSRSHVANTLRLLKLPEPVLAYLRSGQITAGHARTLIGMPDPESAAKQIVESGLTVRDAERAAQSGDGRGARNGSLAPAAKDADTVALERRLSEVLGLRVGINHRGHRGEMRLRYDSMEQLDDLCRRLERSG